MKYDADYSISKDQHVWAYSPDMKPVLTVDPGAKIHLETWDCFTGQVNSEEDTVEKLDLNRVNSATGPIFVNGAQPGDTLSVTFHRIDPGPQGGIGSGFQGSCRIQAKSSHGSIQYLHVQR